MQTNKTGSGVNALTTVALTHDGRAALERYTAVLRQLLDTAEPSAATGQEPSRARRDSAGNHASNNHGGGRRRAEQGNG